MAIMPLLKTKGLLATAIAWAAFCMPISMMRVRCSFWFRRMDLDSKTPPPIASKMSTEMHNPNFPNWVMIVA